MIRNKNKMKTIRDLIDHVAGKVNLPQKIKDLERAIAYTESGGIVPAEELLISPDYADVYETILIPEYKSGFDKILDTLDVSNSLIALHKPDWDLKWSTLDTTEIWEKNDPVSFNKAFTYYMGTRFYNLKKEMESIEDEYEDETNETRCGTKDGTQDAWFYRIRFKAWILLEQIDPRGKYPHPRSAGHRKFVNIKLDSLPDSLPELFPVFLEERIRFNVKYIESNFEKNFYFQILDKLTGLDPWGNERVNRFDYTTGHWEYGRE
jgi:hypothetical protein